MFWPLLAHLGVARFAPLPPPGQTGAAVRPLREAAPYRLGGGRDWKDLLGFVQKAGIGMYILIVFLQLGEIMLAIL